MSNPMHARVRDKSTDSGTLPGHAEPSTVHPSVNMDAHGAVCPHPNVRADGQCADCGAWLTMMGTLQTSPESYDAALAIYRRENAELRTQLATRTAERDAYKRAKTENDDRFMGERDELAQRLAAAQQDAARYRWLRERYHGADFDYDSSQPRISVLTFRIADDATVGANLDATIDAARAAGGTP